MHALSHSPRSSLPPSITIPHNPAPTRHITTSRPISRLHAHSTDQSGASTSQQGEGSQRSFPNRRSLMLAAQSLVAGTVLAEQPALAERGLSKYIKKKALDPLETYVPVVLEAREQLEEAGQVMLSSPDTARQLLRSGPFSTIRENVRVLGEYAVINGQAEKAAPLVTGFFRALEDYDYELKRVVKQQAELDKDKVQELFGRALNALDDLLYTVPEDVLQKSRNVLEVARRKSLMELDDARASEMDDTKELLPKPAS